jgi:hypothetical protein
MYDSGLQQQQLLLEEKKLVKFSFILTLHLLADSVTIITFRPPVEMIWGQFYKSDLAVILISTTNLEKGPFALAAWSAYVVESSPPA